MTFSGKNGILHFVNLIIFISDSKRPGFPRLETEGKYNVNVGVEDDSQPALVVAPPNTQDAVGNSIDTPGRYCFISKKVLESGRARRELSKLHEVEEAKAKLQSAIREYRNENPDLNYSDNASFPSKPL